MMRVPVSLFSADESKEVQKIRDKQWFVKRVAYPSVDRVMSAQRTTLVYWYRFLSRTPTRDERREKGATYRSVIHAIIDRLYQTNPANPQIC